MMICIIVNQDGALLDVQPYTTEILPEVNIKRM